MQQLDQLRHEMVQKQLIPRGIRDPRILAAFDRVPRHAFIDAAHWNEAYSDHPIPIEEGQTISQPYIVAAMLEALRLRQQDKVLEIGTGSGYQTALLCEVVDQVYTIERHEKLATAAAAALHLQGYNNWRLKQGDGTLGWEEFAPFDAIVVSAAAPQVPQALLDQLALGGTMIIPIGNASEQALFLIRRGENGLEERRLEGVRFVPLIGQQGFEAA